MACSLVPQLVERLEVTALQLDVQNVIAAQRSTLYIVYIEELAKKKNAICVAVNLGILFLSQLLCTFTSKFVRENCHQRFSNCVSCVSRSMVEEIKKSLSPR